MDVQNRVPGGPLVTRRALIRASAAVAAAASLPLRLGRATAATVGDERWHHAVGVTRYGQELVSLVREEGRDRLHRWRDRGEALDHLGADAVELPTDLEPVALVSHAGRLLVFGHTVHVDRRVVDSGYDGVPEADRAMLPPGSEADTIELTTEEIHAVEYDIATGRLSRLAPDVPFSVVTAAASSRQELRLVLGSSTRPEGFDIERSRLVMRRPGTASRSVELAPFGGELWGVSIGGVDGDVIAATVSGGTTVVRTRHGQLHVPTRGHVVGVNGRAGTTTVDVLPIDDDRIVRMVHRDGAWRESAVTRDRRVVDALSVAGEPGTSVIVHETAGASLATDEA